MYWTWAVAMETAVPSYLSLGHKQALASNVIPVNMRESDEKGMDPFGSISPFSTVWMSFCVDYLDCAGCYQPAHSLQGHCWVIYHGRGAFTGVFVCFLHPSALMLACKWKKGVRMSQEKLSFWSYLFHHVLPCIYSHFLFISIPFGCAWSTMWEMLCFSCLVDIHLRGTSLGRFWWKGILRNVQLWWNRGWLGLGKESWHMHISRKKENTTNESRPFWENLLFRLVSF